MAQTVQFNNDVIAKLSRYIPLIFIFVLLIPSSFVIIDAGKVGVVKRLGLFSRHHCLKGSILSYPL